MRKILIIIIIIILLILGYFMIIDGIKVLGINVLSIKQIKEKNDLLNSKLEEVSTLTSADYPATISSLNESAKQLSIEKANYADAVYFSSSNDVNMATQVEKYEMEYLWAKIGNHATKNKTVLKIDIKTSSSGTSNVYDLYFTSTGSYISISEFIAAIEDDSSLSFKIEDFKLLPANNNELEATFTVRDISINIDETSNDIDNSIQNDINTETSTDIQNDK